MDWETWKIVGAAIAGAVVIGKGLSDIFHLHWSRQRERYQFVRDYIATLNTANTHPYILESGFRAMTGENLSVSEIRHLLTLEQPTVAISARVGAAAMVEFDPYGAYRWAGTYRRRFMQNHGRKIFLTSYILTATFAVLPWVLPSKSFELFSLQTFYSGLFIVLAFASLNTADRVKLAHRLMHLEANRACSP